MEQLTLRQATNNIVADGTLSKKELEFTTDGNGDNIVKGFLEIKTGKNNFTKLKVYTKQMTNSGSENKTYKALATVEAEYQSIVDTGNEETATKVHATGKLSEGRPYKNQQGEVVVYSSYDLGFITRDIPVGFEPHAELECEAFISGYKPETVMKDGEMTQTGRTIIGAVIPCYGNKAVPVRIIADGEGAEYMMEEAKKTSTVMITVALVNNIITKEAPKTTGGFGKKPDSTPKSTYVNELYLIGANEPYEAFDVEVEGEQKAYNPEAITQALAVRAEAIEEAKNAPVANKASQPKKGFGTSKAPAKAPAQAPAKTPEFEDDDLPF